MEMVLALAIGVLTGSGVWLLLRPRTFQVIMGLALLSYAVNLFIFSMGRLGLAIGDFDALGLATHLVGERLVSHVFCTGGEHRRHAFVGARRRRGHDVDGLGCLERGRVAAGPDVVAGHSQEALGSDAPPPASHPPPAPAQSEPPSSA